MKKNIKPIKIIDGETLREYQEPEIFKLKFQQSKTCNLFRKAWHIPTKGFSGDNAYYEFHAGLTKKDSEYIKSDKYKLRYAEIVKKRKKWAEGKIRKSDLDFTEHNFSLFIPGVKYNFDLDRITILEKKPIYWRDFVEECLLLKNPLTKFVYRPLPEPKIEWSNDLQRYKLIIENIFSDTTNKDFDNPIFTEKLKNMQKKLSGYGRVPRSKGAFKIDSKILESDKNLSSSSDWEKVDYVYGEQSDISKEIGAIETKRKKAIEVRRHRIKKRLGII